MTPLPGSPVTRVTTVTTANGRALVASRADRPLAAAGGRRRRWGGAALAGALLALASLGGGCTKHGTPEQVARACEHQLTVAKRGAIAARIRAAGGDSEGPAGRAEVEASVRDALADAAGQNSLERCRALYVELPVERLDCILAASDPVTINACMPQADRHR